MVLLNGYKLSKMEVFRIVVKVKVFIGDTKQLPVSISDRCSSTLFFHIQDLYMGNYDLGREPKNFMVHIL